MKKVISLSLALLLMFTGVLSASGEYLPENALSVRADDSAYIVMKLDDVSVFLKWMLSEENVKVFMPLILSSEDSNDIIGGIEIMKLFAEKTPLKSAALIIGSNKGDSKETPPFFQIAMSFKPEVSTTLKAVADGTATDKDFVKLLMGNDNPLAAMLETMLKAEKLDGNVYHVDNTLFVKAEGDLVLMGMSADELKASINALNDSEARLFGKRPRRLSAKDFMLFHSDYETIDKLDTDHALDDADALAAEYFDKPLTVEVGFESEPEKFVLSFAFNIKEAIAKKYADEVIANEKRHPAVKGSNIELFGNKNPLFAMGGYLTLSALKDNKDTKEIWDEAVRQLRVRFGITEDEFAGAFNGAFSAVINDSVTVEGLTVPALYFSATCADGVAAKVFDKLSKSPHFNKVQEGILQVDTSLSPVSCLVRESGEKLGIFFAELSNISGTPSMKPALKSLTEAEGVSATWIDFDGIRNWILDEDNGVLAMKPMAKMMGFGEVADAVHDALTAEFSVPSMSVRAESLELFTIEFANAKINPDNGLFAKLIKIYRNFTKK